MTPARPRILFVSPRPPFPLTSGTNIRIHHLTQALAQVADVDFLGYAFASEMAPWLAGQGPEPEWWSPFRSVRLLRHPLWPELSPARYERHLRRRLFGNRTVVYHGFPGESLQSFARPYAAQADLVWAERLAVGLGLGEQAAKTIVDLDDLESVKTARQAEVETDRSLRAALRREAGRQATAERGSVGRFLKVAVCSENDRALLGAADDTAWVLPNGVDDALVSQCASRAEPMKLVFVGTMSYAPNESCMLEFVRDTLPRIQARLPQVTLAIVGLNPPPSIQALHGHRGVTVHPNVPSVVPYVQDAALCVVPLRVGGGTRLKILEALALGTPVVSTTIGAEGLDLDAGEHIAIADSNVHFAETVVRLLTDRAARQRLAEGGHRRVQDKYRWSAIRAELAERCRALLSERRLSPRLYVAHSA